MALLHKSAEGRSSPFPGQTYPVTSVMGVPSAVKPLRISQANATGPRAPAMDTDLELCDLTVEVAGGEALAQQLDAVHLGFCAASAVIPAPSSPDGSADALRCAQDFVAGDRSRGVGFPGFGVLAGRNDRGGATGCNGVVAFAGVEGAVGGDGGDLLLGRDLVQQLGQHPRRLSRTGGVRLLDVANVTGGELGGPDFQSSSGKWST